MKQQNRHRRDPAAQKKNIENKCEIQTANNRYIKLKSDQSTNMLKETQSFSSEKPNDSIMYA